MKPGELKLRVVGSKENCERILSLLKPEAKIWGKRRLWKVRKFQRDEQAREGSKYGIFGNAECAYYVRMTMRDRKNGKEKKES